MFYRITIDEIDQFYCRDNKTVMRTMCDNNSGPIQHGCCGGGCGICKMQIVSGEYDVVSPMSREHISEKEEQEGTVLLCCVVPHSDLIIVSS